MPHVSKKPLKHDELAKLYDRLIRVVVMPKHKEQARAFFEELFTDTEKIMFAKRLAIIFMLTEGLSFYKIGKALKVSTSTICRMEDGLEGGRYDGLLGVIGIKRVKDELSVDLEVLLRAGMPSMGRDRWRGFKNPLERKALKRSRYYKK